MCFQLYQKISKIKLIVIIFFYSLLGCEERHNEFEGCELLGIALSNEHVLREFSLCNKDLKFVLYDKGNNFMECKEIKVCDKKIDVSHSNKYAKLSPNYSHIQKDESIIVLHRMEKSGTKCKLFFWRPYSGAAVNLTYKMNYNLIELNDYTIGRF